MKRVHIILIITAVVLLVTGTSYWKYTTTTIRPSAGSAQAEIDLLDVGQGDAIYIRASNGDDILIDGGPDNTVLERLGQVMPFWDRTIELVVSTHPDADHSTGLIGVFQNYQVGAIMINDMPIHTATYRHLITAIATESGCQVIHPQAGQTWQLGQQDYFTVLYPWVDTQLAELDTNDTSIFLEYHYVGTIKTATALFTGDASELVEHQLVDAAALTPIDLLKVGHHGSRTSSSQNFLDALQPRYAAISVGTHNAYGHPTQEAMNRLGRYAQIFRTDQLGMVTFDILSDGTLTIQ